MVRSNHGFMRDVTQWDTVSWTRAINAWKVSESKGKKALGLGEAKGGLSLYFATLGCEVVCSDYQWMNSDEKKAAEVLHHKYQVNDRITYKDIDATDIPYENEFDIIFFKSILGGIGRNGNHELISKVFDQAYKALKPGGKLYYAENLKGTRFLQWFRGRVSIAYKSGWTYFDEKKLISLEGKFTPIERHTFGCIACIGPTETIRSILGRIDILLEKVVKDRYIISCVLQKKEL